MKITSVLFELIDICNLNCAYCLRDELALHGRPHALPISDLSRILAELQALAACCDVVFTGGEPTLHPEFRLALKTVSEFGGRYTIVTNGWTFARSLAPILEFRDALGIVAFSIDGSNRAEHDAARGKGSFNRLMQAVLACRRHKLPFCLKATMDRRKGETVRDFVDFAARLGAEHIELGPLFPATPQSVKDTMGIVEQQRFLGEVNHLRSIYRMPIRVAAGFFAPKSEPTCAALLGHAINIDYHGRLVLCNVLAGFRGQVDDADVIADLRKMPLAEALSLLSNAVESQNRRRVAALAAVGPEGPGLELGSPCFDCLCSFGKMPRGRFDAPEKENRMHDAVSFTVPESIIASEFDGTEAVLLDTSTQRYHTLNETATVLWSEIERGQSVASMIAALVATFDVDDVRARASVIFALTRLESQGLVQRHDSAPLVSAPQEA